MLDYRKGSLAIFLGTFNYAIGFSALHPWSTTRRSERVSVSLASIKNGKEEESWTRRDFVVSNAIAASLAGVTGLSPSHVFAAEKMGNEGKENMFYGPVVPFSSRREYRDVTLNNGLRVLLVSDKSTVRATAALSIGGAGQFADPDDLPGLAHLMEHMCLSSTSNVAFGKSTDFEEWLGDREGASNAFTAPGMVCFHFNSPTDVFQDALERFGSLFVQETVEQVCRNKAVLAREIRRVDSELDFTSDASRAFYLLKDIVNPAHPFSRFGAGSLETLERNPKEAGIDVGRRLFEFFCQRYQPSQAVLVVVSSADLNVLERCVSSFSSTLSRGKARSFRPSRPYPDPFPSRPTQIVLLRSKDDPQEITKLSFQWPLKMLYNGVFEQSFPTLIGAPAVGFVVARILGRRGPGGLYLFLLRRGWVPKGTQGIPRITFPVDLSGFQIMKLELGLTPEGFANRSAVVAAVYNSINAVSKISVGMQPFLMKRDLICQYITTAYMLGFVLAPRPPDAVELAVDAQTYGVGGQNGVGVPGRWPLMPSVGNTGAVDALRRAVADTLMRMSRPSKSIVTIVVSPKAVTASSSLVDQSLPAVSSRLWKKEPRTGARYFEEYMMGLAGLVEMWIAERFDEDELGPPTLNPLIPSRLRPARPIIERRAVDGGRRFIYLDDSQGPGMVPEEYIWREFLTETEDGPITGAKTQSIWEQRAFSSLSDSNWKLWQIAPNSVGTASLPWPMTPPEPSCRCSFVVQLLSARPARASVKQAAHAQLWLLSFQEAIADLAELGAPGALAYDIGFNKFGLRICFLGISQTLPSYARRFCRRLVAHNRKLATSDIKLLPETVDMAVDQVKRFNSVSKLRKREIIGVLCDTSAFEAAVEGSTFLRSCSSTVCVAQGDLLPNEAVGLLSDLQSVFRPVTSEDEVQTPALPELSEVLYKPMWKPRSASSCLISGVSLISDACGRIQR